MKRKTAVERLEARRGNKEAKIDAPEMRTLLYGEHRIDLASVEQLVHIDQTRTIGLMILYYAQKYASSFALVDGLSRVFKDVEEKGLDILSPWKVGNLALPRLHEAAAAINRIRDEG